MYLFDTDTLTHLYGGQPNVVERLRTVDDPDVGITIITTHIPPPNCHKEQLEEQES